MVHGDVNDEFDWMMNNDFVIWHVGVCYRCWHSFVLDRDTGISIIFVILLTAMIV